MAHGIHGHRPVHRRTRSQGRYRKGRYGPDARAVRDVVAHDRLRCRRGRFRRGPDVSVQHRLFEDRQRDDSRCNRAGLLLDQRRDGTADDLRLLRAEAGFADEVRTHHCRRRYAGRHAGRPDDLSAGIRQRSGSGLGSRPHLSDLADGFRRYARRPRFRCRILRAARVCGRNFTDRDHRADHSLCRRQVGNAAP